MTDMLLFNRISSVAIAVVAAAFFSVTGAHAITSPYVTSQSDIPLDQATDDDVNGIVPTGSHTPLEGATDADFARLTDANSSSTPTANLIPGPDETWVGMTWDFGGTPEEIASRRLDRIDVWIAAYDNLRKGYRGDFSISVSGEVDDFTVIPNSEHWEGLGENEQFNLVRYEFPSEFIPGEEEDGSMDRHPVQNFRYLRFNSRGDRINDTDWQSRYVEVDIWVSEAPWSPPTLTLTPLPMGENGTFRMLLSGGKPSAGYVLTASEDLADWTEIDWGWTNEEGTYEFADSDAPSFSRRFYRAALLD